MPQLQRILNLEDRPDEFDNEKHKIKALVQKHLDVRKKTSDQPDAIAIVKRKLKKEYPAVYGGEDSDRILYFVGRVIGVIHATNRKAAKYRQFRGALRELTGREITDSNTNRSRSEIPLAELLSNRSGKARASTPDSPSRNGVHGQATESGPPIPDDKDFVHGLRKDPPIFPPTPSSVARPRIKKRPFVPFVLVPATPNIASVTAMGASSQNLEPASAEEINRPIDTLERPPKCACDSEQSQTTGTPSGSQIQVAPEPTSSLSSGSEPSSTSALGIGTDKTKANSDVASVRQFLLACKPSMVHFLPHFINFGWNNKEFLYAISSWSDDYRYQMLRKVVGTPTRDSQRRVANDINVGGDSATEAEIAILDYHFMGLGFQVENADA